MGLVMPSITYLLAQNLPAGSTMRCRLRPAWPVVFVVVAALLLGAIPPAVQAQSTVDYDTDDDGLIEVTNLAQLNAIRWDLDGNGSSENSAYQGAFPNAPDGMGCPSGVCSGYELTTDLDFDTDGDSVSGPGDDYWNEGSGWDPIGDFDNARFNTTFDGNGHTISNLYINRMTGRWIGLFGFGNWGSTVINLGLIDVNVNGDGYVGGVMGGHYQGRITACFSTGQVSGHDMIGGLIGRSSRGKITTSYSTATVSGDDDIGGLVGWLETNGLAVVRASYATGSVSGDQYVAGLVGYHASGTIQASYATWSVSGNGHLGGLASGTGSGIVTDSYWDTQRTGQAASIGGMGKTTAELRAPTGYVGAYANWNLDLDGVEGGEDPWDFGDTDDYPLLKVDFNGDDDATWPEFGTQQMVPDPPVLTALVGSANQFTVDWSAPVGDGRSDVIAYDVRYILTNSDPSSDSNWIMVESAWTVGPFAYTVTGLGNGLEYAAEVRAVNAVGASRWSNPGNDYDTDDNNLIEIDSLARLNAVRWDLDGNGASDLDADESRYLANRAGYLAAFPNGAPRMGCPAVACDGYELTADLDFDTDGSGDANSGDEYWNGGAGWEPIGWFDDGRLVIEFHGTLDGNHHAISNLFLDRPYLLYDGLIGYVGASGVVRDLGLKGTDVSANIHVGGLAGVNAGSIHAVRVSGSVHGVFDVGGLVGRNQGSISGSYAKVNASGDDTVGGLVGFNDGGDIVTSYSAGDVSGRQILGGLVGYNEGDISASYSASSVTATGKSAGGLVGRNHRRTDGTHGAILSSYSTGWVTGATEVGGLVGLDEATITDSYWNTETSGQATSAGGVGKTTAQLTGPTDATGIYASWNSGETATWNFGAGDQYPVLVVDLDGNGDATWQEFGDQRTLTPPGAPTIESFTRAPGQLTVAWSAPEHDGGSEILSYLVRYILSSRDQTVDDNWTVVYGAWTSGALEYTVTGLEFDAGKYTMQVKAANQRFAGEWSAAESTSTIVAPILTVSDSEPAPGEPVVITATLRQPDSGATYQWQRLFRQWRDVGPESSAKRAIFDSAGTRIYRAVVTLSNEDIVRSAPLSLTWE